MGIANNLRTLTLTLPPPSQPPDPIRLRTPPLPDRPYFAGHSLISPTTWAAVQADCTSETNPSTACLNDINDAHNEVGNVNIYNVNGDCITGSSRIDRETGRRVHSRAPVPVANVGGPIECIDETLQGYVNTPAFAAAFHVLPQLNWAVCGSNNSFAYSRTEVDERVDVYPVVIAAGVTVLIYNGASEGLEAGQGRLISAVLAALLTLLTRPVVTALLVLTRSPLCRRRRRVRARPGQRGELPVAAVYLRARLCATCADLSSCPPLLPPLCVPLLFRPGPQWWTASMNYTLAAPWTAWNTEAGQVRLPCAPVVRSHCACLLRAVTDESSRSRFSPRTPQKQVGGYLITYQPPQGQFAFATVRAAGHMVPQFEPAAAFSLFNNFISGALNA